MTYIKKLPATAIKGKQKYHPEFRDLKFKGETEFNRWLSATASYILYFKDKWQDCTKWVIDAGGEVLHADMQGRVWNGMCVDLAALKAGENVSVVGNSISKKPTTYDFVVDKIETVKNSK